MNAKVRILNLEDNARDSELIRLRLEAKGVECDLMRVETEADYLRALQQDGIDLIVADLALPTFDGASALELARQYRPEIPFIFFSGTLGEEAAIECIRKGATDYVLKQRPSRLVPAVQRALHEANSERQRLRAEAALRDVEERLRQAHKWESIGILAGRVAHDFNNLLTVIMGSACLARAECPSCEHYQVTLSASERAANLTKQLLQYAGTGYAVVKIVDLTELVSQSTELFSAFVPMRVSLSFNLPKNLPCVEADPSRIEQILMNLVINAGESIPHDRDGLIEVTTGSCQVTPEMARRHSKDYDVAAGILVCLKCGTTAPAWTQPPSRAFSIRSSQPSSPAAAWAWPPSTESYAPAEASSKSTVRPALAPPLGCSCLPPKGRFRRSPRQTPHSNSLSGTQAFSWSTEPRTSCPAPTKSVPRGPRSRSRSASRPSPGSPTPPGIPCCLESETTRRGRTRRSCAP